MKYAGGFETGQVVKVREGTEGTPPGIADKLGIVSAMTDAILRSINTGEVPVRFVIQDDKDPAKRMSAVYLMKCLKLERVNDVPQGR